MNLFFLFNGWHSGVLYTPRLIEIISVELLHSATNNDVFSFTLLTAFSIVLIPCPKTVTLNIGFFLRPTIFLLVVILCYIGLSIELYHESVFLHIICIYKR